MTSPTLPQIVEDLSESEKQSLLSGRCGVPLSHEEWSAECICAAWYGPLIRKGLAMQRTHFPNGVIRTDLGIQVRTHLLSLGEGM